MSVKCNYIIPVGHRLTKIVFTVVILVLLFSGVCFQKAACQSETPYENYKQTLPTVPPHITPFPPPELRATLSPEPTENPVPSRLPISSPLPQPPQKPERPEKQLIGATLVLLVFLIGLLAVLTLKRKFQILAEDDALVSQKSLDTSCLWNEADGQ